MTNLATINALLGTNPDKPVLPPLPAVGAKLAALIDQPKNSTTDNDDVLETAQVLHNHLSSFQSTLLDSVDRQVFSIQEKLNDNDLVLKRTVEERDRVGVELYRANLVVGRLNEIVAVSQKTESKLDEKLRAAQCERDALKQELQSMADMNMTVITELNKAKASLQEETDRASKLMQINATYNSDMKIHHRIENKVKKELEYLDQRRRVAEEDAEKSKKLLEKITQNRNEMDLIMDAQKQETNIANQTIAKMNQEIRMLKLEKERMEKQWEECMTAMSKRDLTFQAVEVQKEAVGEKLNERDMETRALKKELDDMRKKLTGKELECAAFESKIQFLNESLSSLDLKHQETRGALVEAQIAESLYKQELDKVSKFHSTTKEELERKSSTISELKGKLETLKQDFDLKMKNEVVQLAAKKEDQVRSLAQAEIESTKREETVKNVDLRHQNAELALKLNEKDDQLHKMSREVETLKKSYTEINTHYNRLYEEAKHLMYNIERKEHDVNLLKAKIQEMSEGDDTIPYQISMGKLQKDIAGVRAENDKIQKMWLESQKTILKYKNEINRLMDDNVYLRTQLGITETIKIKTSEEIERAQNKDSEHKLEYSRLQSEFRKLQPLVDEYKQKTLTLEQKLIEAKSAIKHEHENAITATEMLKTEIRRLQEDRREEKRSHITDERTTQAIERKYILAKEMVVKLKAERQELQRTCFEFKSKADEMEKRYFEGQIHAKKMAEKAGKTVAEIANRLMVHDAKKLKQNESDAVNLIYPDTLSSNTLMSLQSVKLPPPIWASLATTPRDANSAQTKSEPVPTDNTDMSSSVTDTRRENRKNSAKSRELPDYTAWKLKIESLTSEREYLMHENGVLKQRIDELGIKLSKSEKGNAELIQKLAMLEKELKDSQLQIKTVTAKCQKAQRIAASIEKQYKETRPNIKIDYSLLIEAEPSTQLVAALMFRDSDLENSNSMKGISSPKITMGSARKLVRT